MNDGSALVIFLVLQKIVEGEAVTPGGVSDGCVCWTGCTAQPTRDDQLLSAPN
jgi:hypothetical protein